MVLLRVGNNCDETDTTPILPPARDFLRKFSRLSANCANNDPRAEWRVRQLTRSAPAAVASVEPVSESEHDNLLGVGVDAVLILFPSQEPPGIWR